MNSLEYKYKYKYKYTFTNKDKLIKVFSTVVMHINLPQINSRLVTAEGAHVTHNTPVSAVN